MPHDQRFKSLFHFFLREFFELFFTEWLDLLDFDHVEWLEQELMPDPPDGNRYVLDLVVRVRAKQPLFPWHDEKNPEWLIVILIEIESGDSTTDIRARIPKYSWHLRSKTGLPVLPIVLFLKAGLDGVGKLTHTLMVKNLVLEHSECLYVALPGMDALQYVEGDNLLGVALSALMRIPPERVAWLGAEALRKLVEAPLDDQRKFLLGECVRAYLPMSDEQRAEFHGLLDTKTYSEVKAVNITVYEEGLIRGEEIGQIKGMQQGMQQGLRKGELLGMLAVLTKQHFGERSVGALARIRKNADIPLLEKLVEVVSQAGDWEAFEKLLPP